jgi:6-pyruvoyltetrahydropterin/6-carboxytetrahydropterin synthase
MDVPTAKPPCIRLSRVYEFSSSHELTCLEPNHPCMRNHGHNYVLTLTLERVGELENGMVKEVRALDVSVKPVLSEVDHYKLNDLAGSPADPNKLLAQPSVERIAQWFWWRLQFLSLSPGYRLVYLKVEETSRIYAEIIASR